MTPGNQKLTNLSYTKLILLTATRCWLIGDFGKIELDGPISCRVQESPASIIKGVNTLFSRIDDIKNVMNH